MIASLETTKSVPKNGDDHRTDYVRIVVTKSNPSRGRGFEVAHFVVNGRTTKSISERDVFLPSLTKAAQWVLQRYPSAKLERGCNDHAGHLAALCFRCGLADVVPAESKN